MSADRETNHDMTNTDITLLLADAADEVEIGIAPYQAVIRGGRMTQGAALGGGRCDGAGADRFGGDAGHRGDAGRRPGPGLGGGDSAADTDADSIGDRDSERGRAPGDPAGGRHGPGQGVAGRHRRLVEAARDKTEAQLQLSAMNERYPTGMRQAAELIGKSTYILYRSVGDGDPILSMEAQFTQDDTMSVAGIQSGALPLTNGPDTSQRLVVGQVAPIVQRVTCTWTNGTTTEVHRVPKGYDVNSDDQVIRPVDGMPVNWFVCLAPEGTEYQEVKVTK